MTDEFDVLARWTVEAVQRLGPDHALPAACQGSGGPAVLAWLAEELGLGPDTWLLDLGAGTGGPAEHAARGTGTHVVPVEPMPGACAAARTLFRSPVVVGGEGRLPFVDASFDAAWSLGVLCTVGDDRAQAAHLGELARTVGPEGIVGLLVYERTVEELSRQPEGNHFPRYADLAAELAAAGLRVVTERMLDDLPGPPQDWQDAAARVDAEVERAHGTDPAWRHASEQRSVLGDLLTDGQVRGRLLVCRPTG